MLNEEPKQCCRGHRPLSGLADSNEDGPHIITLGRIVGNFALLFPAHSFIHWPHPWQIWAAKQIAGMTRPAHFIVLEYTKEGDEGRK